MRLDLGVSYARNNKPALALIVERMPATLLLSSTSLILAYALSIPIGLWSTAKSGTFAERSASTVLYMLYSLPAFVAALYLQLLFYVKLGWLPLYGMTGDDYASLSVAGKALDLLKHALLPVTCFTYGSLAYYSRFIRANMQEVVRQDYIRTARAKGVAPRTVIWKHAFRNTLIPLVTLLGLSLPHLLSGAVILEQIFSWPGMGRLYFESITQRDYNVIMGLTLMFSVLTLAGQLLADILYAVVDPRVTYHELTMDLPPDHSRRTRRRAAVPAGHVARLLARNVARFRRGKLALVALAFVAALSLVAATAPLIAGTKPIVCKYKGKHLFPALGYYNRTWENPIFAQDRFRGRYPENLKAKDPDSWAIWPLVYQDPYRRVRDGEWPGQPENPSGVTGRPSRNNWLGTNQQGFDVFARWCTAPKRPSR